MYGLSSQEAVWQTAAAAVLFAAVIVGFVWERWNRAYTALAAAVLVTAVGAVKLSRLGTWIHLPTLALIVGMTAIAGAAQKSGLLAYAAVRLTRLGGGGPARTAGLLLLATGAAGALLDPVAAVLTLVPLGLKLGALLGLQRSPLLFGQMLAASLGGAMTLNGSPVNMLLAAAGSFSYVQVLLHVGLPAFALLLLLVLLLPLLFRGRAKPDLMNVAAEWRPQAWLRDEVLMRNSAAALGIVTLSFLLHHWIRVHPGWIALLAAAVLVAVSRGRYDVRELAADVDWRTAGALLGLFVVAGALVDTGAVAALADRAAELAAGSLPLLAALLLWVSAVLSAALGPLPVAALLVQLVPALGAAVPAAANAALLHPLWWALALGCSLGAAASPLGAPGHVAALTLAAREKEPAGVADFLRWSVPIVFAGLVLACVYTLLL
jgi:Na+/H+ antiporter NhaD/arsenite permease-like protein